MTKYRNILTEIDGITFGSNKEAQKYRELCLLLKVQGADGVKHFSVHPKFMLQAAFEKDGKKYKPIYYIADFDVTYNSGIREIIDVKPFDEYFQEYYLTNIFKLKQKMFDSRYPELTLVIE